MANGMVDLAVHQWSEDKRSSWVQIMTTGKWQHPKQGEVQITTADLQRFKENYDNNVRGVKLFTDVSHKPDDGAVAEWEELQVRGNALFAKMAWTDEGAKLVQSGKYNYFSPEFMFQWTDPATGKSYKDVLLGGAITNRPFLKNMERIALSEDDDMFQVRFAEGETYDPDHDGDNDSTTDPSGNPDWMLDVLAGITRWPSDEKQQAKLTKVGATKQAVDAAYKMRQKQLGSKGQTSTKMSDGDTGVTNSHKSPPKGKPKNKALYADPENYKYPIDKKHVHAAVSYYNQDGMQSKGGYSDSQWASIGSRIANAAGDGYSLKDGKIVTPSTHKMSDDSYDPGSEPDDVDGGGVATAHGTDDTDSGKYSEPNGGVLKMAEGITMDDWTAAQNKIKALEESERRHKFTEQSRGWMFNENSKTGKLLPAQQDKVVELMMGMSDEQATKFSEFIEGLPDAVSFGEIGTSNGSGGKRGSTDDQVVKLAEKKMSENHMEWKEAFLAASDELGVK